MPLGLLALGNVLHCAAHVQGLVLGVTDQLAATKEIPDRAVGPEGASFQVAGLLAGGAGAQPFLHFRPSVGMNELEQRLNRYGERFG